MARPKTIKLRNDFFLFSIPKKLEPLSRTSFKTWRFLPPGVADPGRDCPDPDPTDHADKNPNLEPAVKKNWIRIRSEKLDPNPESNPKKTTRIRPNENYPQLFSFDKKVNIIDKSLDKTGSVSDPRKTNGSGSGSATLACHILRTEQ